MREHDREYGADPTAVIVAGSSAGGHLAASAALTPNDPAFKPGFEGADTSVTAPISLYGFYGAVDEAAGVPSSPVAYVGSDAPPFFVAHGDQDTLAPVDGARLFVERLRSTSSIRLSTRSFPQRSIRSTCSIPSASRRSSTDSKPSPPG